MNKEKGTINKKLLKKISRTSTSYVHKKNGKVKVVRPKLYWKLYYRIKEKAND